MKEIYLVRHGKTDYNINNRIIGHLDVPLLEDEGKKISLIANSLKNEKIDVILSSDLKRAV